IHEHQVCKFSAPALIKSLDISRYASEFYLRLARKFTDLGLDLNCRWYEKSAFIRFLRDGQQFMIQLKPLQEIPELVGYLIPIIKT
ncbi:MAG: hypothetical protein Q8Q89_05195, partial [bacterium]|nr:hypothetical protein [bacterium]